MRKISILVFITACITAVYATVNPVSDKGVNLNSKINSPTQEEWV